MNINELHSFKLSDAVKFHSKLNPKLWVGNRLKLRVRSALLEIAKDFIAYLGISKLEVKDVTISGSNSAYSYTDHSDIDLHILIDFSKLDDDEVYRELFNAKKALYNDYNKITIYGIEVECYVQDSNEPAVTLGEFSVMHNRWIKLPSKRRANLNQTSTKLKFQKLRELVLHAIKSNNNTMVNELIRKIQKYRQSGLSRGGEFSPENLAFKLVRNMGLLDKLYNHRNNLHGKELSIENRTKSYR